jgi:excisionase family DNA binding protein
MSPEPARRILTIAQACVEVGVSRRSIYNWLAAGKVAFCRTAGGAVRIYADTLTRPGAPAEFIAPERQRTTVGEAPFVADVQSTDAAPEPAEQLWTAVPGYREHCEQRWREAQRAPRG